MVGPTTPDQCGQNTGIFFRGFQGQDPGAYLGGGVLRVLEHPLSSEHSI